MWLGNQLFMVVSDPAIVKDLLVTNGGIFSSRKEMFIKSQTVLALVPVNLRKFTVNLKSVNHNK
jgi:hypothetical protein